MYIENFFADQLVKEFGKSVHVCQSYYQTSSCFLFGTHCTYVGRCPPIIELSKTIFQAPSVVGLALDLVD